MTDAVLPDAAPANWVDRYAPKALRPWLKLGRFDRPAGIWLLMLPGWQGVALADSQAHELVDGTLLLRIAAGAALMRAAGCAFNDVADRDLDRRVARTAGRPVASGAIGARAALLYAAGLSLVAFLILLTMGGRAILLGCTSLGLVAAYPYMKRITWWPQAWLGLTFNWGVLLGYAATGRAPGAADLLLYASGIAWTLGYDTVYALQDLEDDALAGVKSSARRLGGAVRTGVGVFYAASALFALASVAAAGLGPLAYAGVAAFALHLAWQVRRLRPADAAGALRLFKSNAWAGLLLAAGLAAGVLR